MATDINRVFLIGRATKEPELRTTQGGTAIASLSIANNRTYMAGSEKKEDVSFFNCIAWGKLGETISKYVKKGDKIAIEGRLQQRSWQDKDGGKRSTVEIVVENVQFLGGKQNGQTDSSQVMGEEVKDGSVPKFDDCAPSHFSDEDIPF